MKNDKKIFEECELICRIFEGDITPEDFKAFESRLHQDSELLGFYAKVAEFHGHFICPGLSQAPSQCPVVNDDSVLDMQLWEQLLHEEKTAKTIEIHPQTTPEELIQKVVYPPREKYTISKFSIISFVVSAAAILFLVGLVLIVPSSDARPVASITGGCKAIWEDSENESGFRLWNDGQTHYLKGGVAELTFDSGATVLIESPATLEVLDENRMYFEGRLTAQVPQSARNFTVETPNSKVVDLGTEFGLMTSLSKGTEVHVRKGTVEHMAAMDTKLVLGSGQASRMDESGNVSRVACRNEQFRWDRPNEYEMTVIAMKPAAYYRFEKRALGFDEVARNVTLSDFTGQIDLVSGPGIERENKSLRFNGQTGSEAFIVDKVLEQAHGNGLTISLWVCPEQGMGQRQNIILHTNQEKGLNTKFTNQIFLAEDNRVVFYFYNINGEGRVQIETQVPIPFNQWSHITASYDKKNVKLYVNGEMQMLRALNENGEPGYYADGYWAIGSASGKAGEVGVTGISNSFKGSIDELSLYSRQLSDEEVTLLYKAAQKTDW